MYTCEEHGSHVIVIHESQYCPICKEINDLEEKNKYSEEIISNLKERLE